MTCFEIEETKDFGSVHAQRDIAVIPITQHRFEELTFFTQDAIDAFLDRVF